MTSPSTKRKDPLDTKSGWQCLGRTSRIPGLEVTKVHLPSKLPKCRCLPCSPLYPGGVSRPRSYQIVTLASLFIVFLPCQGGVSRPRSVSIYRLLPSAQVVIPGFEITEELIFIVFPASAQVVFPSLEVTKVLKFIVFPPLPKWCFPPSKLPKCRHLSCFPLCPCGVSRP